MPIHRAGSGTIVDWVDTWRSRGLASEIWRNTHRVGSRDGPACAPLVDQPWNLSFRNNLGTFLLWTSGTLESQVRAHGTKLRICSHVPGRYVTG